MSCAGDCSDPAGIRVRGETLVASEDDPLVTEKRDTPSLATAPIQSGDNPSSSQRNDGLKPYPEKPDPSRLLNDMPHSGVRRQRETRTERGTVKDLVDFFRNIPPPPSNLMSITDPVDREGKRTHKFLRLWPLRKRPKSDANATKGPGLIKLPDSAVAGTTIDGHRHISISIPIEHAHLDLLGPGSALSPDEAPNVGDDGDGRAALTSATNGQPSPPLDVEKARSQGAHKTNATTSPEPTASRQGPTPADVGMAAMSSSQNLPRRRRSSSRSCSLGNTELDHDRDSSCSRPSIAGCSTDSTELIYSDASTVDISSFDLTGIIYTPGDTESYYTAELAQSPSSVEGRRTGSVDSLDGSSSPVFDFSSPHNGSTTQTSVEQAAGVPHFGPPAFGESSPYQPHTLSPIASLESLLPSELSQTLTMAPVVTVVNIPPSPPDTGRFEQPRHPQQRLTHRVDYATSSSTPQRMAGFAAVRGTSPSALEHTTTTTTTTTTAPDRGDRTEPPVPHALLVPSRSHAGPIAPPRRNRNRVPGADADADADTEAGTYTNRDSGAHHTRNADLTHLLSRLDRLERSHERWLTTALASPHGLGLGLGLGLGRVSRRLVARAIRRPSGTRRSRSRSSSSSDGGSGRRDSSSSGGDGSDLGLGVRWGCEAIQEEGGGGRAPFGLGSPFRSGTPSRAHVYSRSLDELGGLDTLDTLAEVDGRIGVDRVPASESGEARAGLGLLSGTGRESHDEPGLTWETDSRGVLGLRRLGPSGEGPGSDWRTAFTGREAVAFVSERRALDEGELNRLDAAEDPQGWNGLELVMRELVLGHHGQDGAP